MWCNTTFQPVRLFNEKVFTNGNKIRLLDQNVLRVDSWLVTAAHCVQRGKETTAFFGIRRTGEFMASINIPAANQFIHPEFNQTAYTDDIGKLHKYG